MALVSMPDDRLFLTLAREIAADINNLETILDAHQIDAEQWASYQTHPRFVQLLVSAKVEWSSAENTEQRVKIKSAAMIEMWLEEAHRLLHSTAESLSAKTELAKLIARFAGMGLAGAGISDGGGERFSLTINLGADRTLKFTKELPAKVIDHEPVQEITSGNQAV